MDDMQREKLLCSFPRCLHNQTYLTSEYMGLLRDCKPWGLCKHCRGDGNGQVLEKPARGSALSTMPHNGQERWTSSCDTELMFCACHKEGVAGTVGQVGEWLSLEEQQK